MAIRSQFHTKAFFVALIIAVVFTIFFALGIFHLKKPIYIAVVSTLSGDEQAQGESLVKGAKLYIEQVNHQGGVNGRPIELLSFDDQGNPEIARQKAKEIVADNKALVVLGHYSSNLCLAGGEIYKEAHIPAITPSCTDDAVTKNNDWYFSVVPNNKYEGTFLANYAKRIMKHEVVNIIYDDKDNYSLSLATSFENAFRGLRGTIKHKWIVNANTNNFRQQIDIINKKFLQTEPGLIFLALRTDEAEKLVVSMRRNGMKYPILGGNALGKETFAKNFKKYPEEMAQSGYFSDGIYASSPLIFDVADEYAQQQRDLYIQTYSKKPTWTAAAAGEAIFVAITAIKEMNIQGEPSTLIKDRQKIRDYLAKRTNPETGFQGINGHFYFDQQGNAVKPLAVGVFKQGQFISALTQFQPVSAPNRIPNLAQEIANGRIIIFAGQYMYKTSIVYTGVDFNEISNLDDKDSTYQVDFYIWFRYQKHFDEQSDFEPTHIEFTNSVTVSFKKLELGKPLFEEISDDGSVYRAYRVKANFKERFNFKDYPFDTQKLAVRFRHAKLTRHNIIYVVDLVGLGDTTTQGILGKLERNKVLGLITDWKVDKGAVFLKRR